MLFGVASFCGFLAFVVWYLLLLVVFVRCLVVARPCLLFVCLFVCCCCVVRCCVLLCNVGSFLNMFVCVRVVSCCFLLFVVVRCLLLLCVC